MTNDNNDNNQINQTNPNLGLPIVQPSPPMYNKLDTNENKEGTINKINIFLRTIKNETDEQDKET